VRTGSSNDRVASDLMQKNKQFELIVKKTVHIKGLLYSTGVQTFKNLLGLDEDLGLFLVARRDV